MRHVLITGDGPEHRYVANRIDRAVGLSAIVVDSGRPQTPAKRGKQLWRRYTLRQLLGRAALAILKRYWNDAQDRSEELRRVLGEDSVELHRPELEIRVNGINRPEAIEILKGLRGDRLLIYGTGIISKRVLKLSPEAPLNMHTGISPFYRGASCAFWPLHDDELHHLGATVHEITSKVDGGNIFSVCKARLEPEDTLHSVFGRCVQVGADQYVEVIQRLEQGDASFESQDFSVGREFRASMRGLMAELRVRRQINAGLVRHWCQAQQDGPSPVASGAGPRT